jgi:hypothetical protein
MSLRKMCVCLLLVAITFWALPSSYIRAANENSNSKTEKDSAVDPATGLKKASADDPSIILVPGQVVTQKPAKKPAKASSSQRRTGTAAGSSGVSRTATVIVGPDGEVQESSTGGGEGGIMIGPGVMIRCGGTGDGTGGGGVLAITQDGLDEAEHELRMRTLDELNKLGIPISDRMYFKPMRLLKDPESQDIYEKELKIEEEVNALVEQYRAEKDGDERTKLKQKLNDISSRQFDIRQQNRALEVKRLEKELVRIRESIQQRTENRVQIIKHRAAQLLHEEDNLDF